MRVKRANPAAVLLAIAFLAGAALAAEPKISCPASITVQQAIANTPPGWQASENRNLPTSLATVSFFDGPPSQEADLVYDHESRAGKERTAVWRFSPGSKHGIWLQCGYAATTVVLSQRLPDDISECTVSYKTDVFIAGMPEVTAIRCRAQAQHR